MSAAEKLILTEDEYLKIEREADTRSEFVHGEIFAMAGGSADHALIAANTIRALGNGLSNRPCRVYGSDLKIRSGEGSHHYPDITALCGPADFHDEKQDVLPNPDLIIEVLSPITEAYDRGTKFSLYRSITSLRDYILISQESATIDHFHKNDAGQWILANDGHPDTLQLPHLEVSIPYAEIYANVEFEQ
jgi:Uma2 family endonuclease